MSVGSTVFVSCVVGLVVCALDGNGHGEGHVWLAVLIVDVIVCDDTAWLSVLG